MQVVVLAGGLATRMGGIAKCLQPTYGQPFFAHWLSIYDPANTTFLWLLGHRAEEIVECVRTTALTSDSLPYKHTFYTWEPEGTLAALKRAHFLLEDTFLLLNADTYVRRWKYRLPVGKLGSLAVVPAYRKLQPNCKLKYTHRGNYIIEYCKEKPTGRHVDAGAVMLSKSVIDYQGKHLSELFTVLAQQKLLAYEVLNSCFYDVGTPEGLEAFTKAYPCIKTNRDKNARSTRRAR
jgi:NDP-sugar pyrophosphorylase family protein